MRYIRLQKNRTDVGLHRNGPWYLENGMLHNRYVNTIVNPRDMALGYDGDHLLKYGSLEMVKPHMENYQKEMKIAGIKTDVSVISFAEYPFLSADDICTIANFAGNTVSGVEIKMMMYSMSEQELKDDTEINMLQSYGF